MGIEQFRPSKKNSPDSLESVAMRFLHAADIHLDSPLRGLARYEGAPVETLRGATRQAFVNLVDQALELAVSFLLIAGDIYDGNWQDYNTGLFFSKQMARLEEANIPVIGLCGNHDAQSRITKGLRLPPNVKMLSVDQAETFYLEDLAVAIHGQGFKKAAIYEDLTENYPPPSSGYFNIGMLHTSGEGRAGHEPYAPCTLEGLRNLGYDYWALGHVHQLEVLCRDPYIVFPGNLQGRHARETGVKGATLVSLNDGVVDKLEHLALDVLRWQKVVVDITGIQCTERVTGQILRALEAAVSECDGRPLAARVEVVGECSVHSQLVADRERWTNEVRNLALQVGSDTVWIEKVKFLSRTEVSLQKMAAQHDAFASLLEGLEALSGDEEKIRALGKELFAELEGKLPRQWREVEEGGVIPSSVEALREALADIPHLLAGRLSLAQESKS